MNERGGECCSVCVKCDLFAVYISHWATVSNIVVHLRPSKPFALLLVPALVLFEAVTVRIKDYGAAKPKAPALLKALFCCKCSVKGMKKSIRSLLNKIGTPLPELKSPTCASAGSHHASKVLQFCQKFWAAPMCKLSNSIFSMTDKLLKKAFGKNKAVVRWIMEINWPMVVFKMQLKMYNAKVAM